MIKVNHLSKKFGNLEVLKDINLDINEGEVVCIIGPSGSGKSTFLRCINQLERPTGGTVQYEGKNLLDKNCDIRKFREEVGMVFQKFNLFPLKTVVQNVMMAPILTKHMNKEEAHAKALELLDKVGLRIKRMYIRVHFQVDSSRELPLQEHWQWNRKRCCLMSRHRRWTRNW